MVGGIFLAYLEMPPKWRIFKRRRIKKHNEEYTKELKRRPLRYR